MASGDARWVAPNLLSLAAVLKLLCFRKIRIRFDGCSNEQTKHATPSHSVWGGGTAFFLPLQPQVLSNHHARAGSMTWFSERDSELRVSFAFIFRKQCNSIE
jgi:hypothetical protein